MPAGTFRLPEDSLMPKILDRHRIVSSASRCLKGPALRI
jgi:hypothetical protein